MTGSVAWVGLSIAARCEPAGACVDLENANEVCAKIGNQDVLSSRVDGNLMGVRDVLARVRSGSGQGELLQLETAAISGVRGDCRRGASDLRQQWLPTQKKVFCWDSFDEWTYYCAVATKPLPLEPPYKVPWTSLPVVRNCEATVNRPSEATLYFAMVPLPNQDSSKQ
jgi:hypothetical protein